MAGIVNPSKDPNVKKRKIDSNQVSIILNPKSRDSGHSCHSIDKSTPGTGAAL